MDWVSSFSYVYQSSNVLIFIAICYRHGAVSTLVHKLLLSLWLWIWFAHNLAEVAVGAVRTGGASTVVSPLFPHHCKQHSEIIIKPSTEQQQAN